MVNKLLIGSLAGFSTLLLIGYARRQAASDKPQAASKLRDVLTVAAGNAAVGQISKFIVDGKTYYGIVPIRGRDSTVTVYDAAGIVADRCNTPGPDDAPLPNSALCAKLLNEANPTVVYRAEGFAGQPGTPFDHTKVSFAGSFPLKGETGSEALQRGWLKNPMDFMEM